MSWVIWITGLPGSGKSTIAEGVRGRIPETEILRMDDLRRVMTPKPDYSESEREYVYRAIIFTAKALYGLGHNVIIDATGNRRSWRELAREVIADFIEVYLECPLKLCREREAGRVEMRGAPRDIYAKADRGWPVPGINVTYEEPEQPEIVINTGEVSPDDASREIVKYLSVRERSA